MNKQSSMGIRLTPEQRIEVEALSKRFKVTTTQIVIWALEALIEYAKKHDGRLLMPLNFEETFEVTGPGRPIKKKARSRESIRKVA